MNEALYTLVFLLPIFFATMYNYVRRDAVRANMKVVYYKFFMFCTILFISSQIAIEVEKSSSVEYVVKILGSIGMFLLILELFTLPGKDTQRH